MVFSIYRLLFLTLNGSLGHSQLFFYGDGVLSRSKVGTKSIRRTTLKKEIPFIGNFKLLRSLRCVCGTDPDETIYYT